MFRKTLRGVICKVEKNSYYILTPKGDFELVRGRLPQGLGLGDELSLQVASQWSKLLAVAAALVLILGGSLLMLPGGTNQPLYALTVDFNPSLGIVFDGYLVVKEVKAYNQAGHELITQLEHQEGENLYLLLNRLAALALEQGLLKDAGDIFFTTDQGVDLDQDLLLGAFEGRGIGLNLVRVTLDNTVKDNSDSPLRGWLKALATEAGDEVGEETIQVLAAKYLPPSQAVRTAVTSWFDEPLVQYLVGEYRVSGGFVNSLLARGFSGEDIALVLAVAREEKLPPGQLVKEVLPETAKKVLAEKAAYQLVKDKGQKARELDLERQSLEYLAAEFGYPVGRLTSVLKQVGDVETLSTLLIMERQGSGDLNRLVQSLRRLGGDLDKLVQEMVEELKAPEPQAPAQEIKQELTKVKENTGRAKEQPSAEVDQLATQGNSTRSNVVWLLGRGYGQPQCQAILRAAQVAELPVTTVARHLENARDWSDFLKRLGLSELKEPHLERMFQGKSTDKPGKAGR